MYMLIAYEIIYYYNDDGRKNSSESSCYAYIYCNFYVFTQLYKSLKYYYKVIDVVTSFHIYFTTV